jgi:hypothetical protein
MKPRKEGAEMGRTYRSNEGGKIASVPLVTTWKRNMYNWETYMSIASITEV